jgi:hypothetical protein
MTGDLEKFLRDAHRAASVPSEPHIVGLEPPTAENDPIGRMSRTLPGIGPGGWANTSLANAQERATRSVGHTKTVYRLYTEDVARIRTRALVARYFEGATLTYGVGLDARTQDTDEESVTIEIVTSKADAFQRIINLAGDIREANNQVSVLITRQDVDTFEVTERTITHGAL